MIMPTNTQLVRMLSELASRLNSPRTWGVGACEMCVCGGGGRGSEGACQVYVWGGRGGGRGGM